MLRGGFPTSGRSLKPLDLVAQQLPIDPLLRDEIDRVEVDGAKREATLTVRLILTHATLPKKDLPHEEIWVLSHGEWYLLPENRKGERRPLRKPGGRPGGEGRDRVR